MAPMDVTAVGVPNETIYCTNLTDKVPKEDLKRSLYMLFLTYGPILDVVALKTMKMRGQAHITFRDRAAATQALRALQGFEFFGKPMKIAYAKTKSDTLAKLDGTYKQPQLDVHPQASEIQKSIFAGPPGMAESSSIPSAKLGAPPSLPAKPLMTEATSTSNQDGTRKEKDTDTIVAVTEEAMDVDDDAMEESDED